MNKRLIIPAFAILSLIMASCGATPKQADLYNRQLTQWQSDVKTAGDSLEQTFRSFDSLLIKDALANAKLITKRNIVALKDKGFLRNDSTLYNAHIKYAYTYQHVLDNEYEKMYKLYCLPDEEYGLKGDKAFRKLQLEKNQKLNAAFFDLAQAQTDFAERYNLTLKKKQVSDSLISTTKL